LKAKTIYSRLKPQHLKKGYKLQPHTHRPVKIWTGKVARLAKAVKKSVYKTLFVRRRRAGESENDIMPTAVKTGGGSSVTRTRTKRHPSTSLNIPSSLKRVLLKHHIQIPATPVRKSGGKRSQSAHPYYAHQSYETGDKVTYRGKVYVALDDIERPAPGHKHTPPSTSSRWRLVVYRG